MGRAHKDVLTNLLEQQNVKWNFFFQSLKILSTENIAKYLVIWWNAVLPASLLGLQQRGQGDVVLGHHPVQHILVTVGVLNGELVKLDKLLLENKP